MSEPKRDVAELVTRLSDDTLGRRERGRLLVALTGLVGSGARAAGLRALVSGRWVADTVTQQVAEQIAPHLPVRDLLTLREHHGGLSGEALAEALVRTASRTTAAVGAGAGAVTAAELAAPPALLTAPVLLAAETIVVVAVELKLVAELHAVFGRAPTGSRAELAVAYLTSWASRRAVPRPETAGGSPRASLASALSGAVRQQVRQRIVHRLGRNLTSFVPFLAGAVAGAELNRRETRALGEALIRDLQPRR